MTTSNPSAARLLIIDRDAIFAESIAEFCSHEGHETMTVLSGAEALEALASAERDAYPGMDRARPFDVALLDLSMHDGAEVLRTMHKKHGGTAVIVTTSFGSVESAVEALRTGACDYITKPIVDEELRLSLQRALRQRALLAENQALKSRSLRGGDASIANVVGADPRMLRVFELVRAVAASKTTVLMTGESGTGKSLIAHAIHDQSTRSQRPYVELSCGSIPETLLESELFGHVKGAFTGAHADKVGRFQAANGGTLFLDEINSASPAMQLKLLRVLQERKLEPVGSSQTIEVDVRVILASNQPLENLVASGAFRQDLYYRINVVKIELPPLRERSADIEELAHAFLTKHAGELGRQLVGFTTDAMDALRRYAYPGNVRELQNLVERAAVLARGQVITLDDLPSHVLVASPVRGEMTGGTQHRNESGAGGRDVVLAAQAVQTSLRLTPSQGAIDDPATPWVPMKLEDALREPEKRIILKALEANHWNRQKTSDQLGINRTTLYKKMKAYGLLDDDDRRMAG